MQYRTWICIKCGFLYDEATGRPQEGIEPGTLWCDVPMDWTCPDCNTGKQDFEMMQI